MRVLIADDDPVVRATLSGLLRQLGHEAVVARNGTEAWELMQAEDAPGLAILDWMMPGLDGVEICRRVRQDTTRAYRYLIMLTAREEIEDLIDGLESGADDYLRKPCDLRELRARLGTGERILAQQDALRARATYDELTGLLNRSAILDRLHRELDLATTTYAPASIILADLDDFKRINDTHGHPVGDEVLRESSRRLASRKRSYDELGRYGGEEFLAVLPGCSALHAAEVAERMRSAVASLPVDTCAGLITLTVSLGVASVNRTDARNAKVLIAAADDALYRAKRAGRNRVEGPLAVAA